MSAKHTGLTRCHADPVRLEPTSAADPLCPAGLSTDDRAKACDRFPLSFGTTDAAFARRNQKLPPDPSWPPSRRDEPRSRMVRLTAGPNAPPDSEAGLLRRERVGSRETDR